MEGDFVYSTGTFGFVEAPVPGSVVTGPLEMRGWFLSDQPVASIRLHLGNGRRIFVAQRFDTPRLDEAFPWYAGNAPHGFRLRFDTRPPGVAENADMQVEVVYADGESDRLNAVWFRWE